ncbi:MAG: hypothetical protein M3O85_08965 [Acidobacteriota bacterium]|nr:hypothetical protein [Acidobacteriota bacterium]
MAKYKISIALMCGAGFASLLVLLLNVRFLPVGMVAAMFLTPGAIAAAPLRISDEFAPFALPAANALVYSGAAYAVIAGLCRRVKLEAMQVATVRLVVPVTIVVGLVCVPALNPLWPRGMAELAKQEKELQERLPLGMELDKARAVLRSKKIQFQEEAQTVERVVLDDGSGTRITAAPGDRVLWAKIETEASQFPCDVEIRVDLLFGKDDRMKQRYIRRFRICP